MRLVLAGWLAALAVPAVGDDWTARVDVRPPEPVVGRPFEVWVQVTSALPGRPGVRVDEPLWGAGLVVLSSPHQATGRRGGEYRWTRCWKVVADTPGPLALPPVRVVFYRPNDGAAETRVVPSRTIRVRAFGAAVERGVAGSDAAPESPGARWVLTVLGAALLLTAAAAGLWLRGEAPRPEPVTGPVATALAAAEAALAADCPETFYGALAGVVSARLAPGAAVLTTAEARAALGRAGLDETTAATLLAALAAADEARYAAAPWSPHEAEALLERVRLAVGQAD